MKQFKIAVKRLSCKVFVMCRLKKQPKFFFEPFIYITKDGFIYKFGIGDRIKWLEKFTVEALIQEDADKIAFAKVKEKYPDYGDAVWFF
jgi:hypothetical protein